MNFVRIPVGYWSVPGVDSGPYVTGAYDFLHAACDWAAGAGIKVMVDLHGGEFCRSLQNDCIILTLHQLRDPKTDSTTRASVVASAGLRVTPYQPPTKPSTRFVMT